MMLFVHQGEQGNGCDTDHVEKIFRSLDPACKGALDKVAITLNVCGPCPSPAISVDYFAQVALQTLAARLNPDVTFSHFQLTIIADEVPSSAHGCESSITWPWQQ